MSVDAFLSLVKIKHQSQIRVNFNHLLFFFLLGFLRIINGQQFAQNSPQQELLNDSLIEDGKWGLFKPHLLFCLTQKYLNPLSFGMLYANVPERDSVMNKLRWKFGNTKDGIFADYTSNNGDDFAEEIIIDRKQNVKINLSFVKDKESTWEVTARFQNMEPSKRSINAYFYLSSSSFIGSAAAAHSLQLEPEEDRQKENDQELETNQSQNTVHNNQIKLRIVPTSTTSSDNNQHKFDTFEVTDMDAISEETTRNSIELQFTNSIPSGTWRMQQILSQNLKNNGMLRNPSYYIGQKDSQPRFHKQCSTQNSIDCQGKQNSNIAIFHIWNDHSNSMNLRFRFTNSTLNGNQKPNLDIEGKRIAFNQRVQQIFGEQNLPLITSALSNLLGGIVFYHGHITVRNNPFIHAPADRSIFSASPSRKIFPRAFLWDEGFHDAIICIWSQELCKQFLNSWMQTQDVFGYIPREQVRTFEISEIVPPEFQIQDAMEANPPTILLGFLRLTENIQVGFQNNGYTSDKQINMDSTQRSSEMNSVQCEEQIDNVISDSQRFCVETQQKSKQNTENSSNNIKMKVQINENNSIFLQQAFPRIEKWFKWFITTQISSKKTITHPIILNNQNSQRYRWQCKGDCKEGIFMGSGLDDYPRQDSNNNSVQHLDVTCWLYFFAESLEKLVEQLPTEGITEDFKDNKRNKYSQLKNQLRQSILSDFHDINDGLFKDIQRNKKNHSNIFTTHIGYITLYPLLFNITKITSPQFNILLEVLHDPKHLWSPYGIRSLSLQDKFYGKDDDYWRGAIWMPLNYLILRSLKLYYFNSTKAALIYQQLRENIIETVQRNWKDSGYLYETYNSETGQGQRGFPFNGWTSLIILIINENYV